MFRVGQKVVCVDDTPCPQSSMPWKLIGTLDGLTKGRIYTIRRIGCFAGRHQVWLDEIVRPLLGSICAKHGEAGYRPSRFRPIVSRPTSIEFAHEILRNVNAPTKEHAHV